MKTMKEAAQKALLAQDACNLSGVAYSFKEMMDLICEEDRKEGHGTDWKNTHPLCVLMLNKMCSLAHADDGFSAAYAWAQKMVSDDSSDA